MNAPLPRYTTDFRCVRDEVSPRPSPEVLGKTANLYQPGTRRPYGVLEWPAMLRLLKAQAAQSGYPPYWN